MEAKPRVIYLGGPVDLSKSEHIHETVDWYIYGLVAYCPRCECQGLTDEQAMEQNMLMVKESFLCLFNLMSHTIGTPIEMFLRCWIHQKPAVIIGKEQSLFIRETHRRFEIPVVGSIKAALEQIKEIADNG